MKGGLRIEDPSGERWELALDLIHAGHESVMLGDRIEVRRYIGWPGADGLIHIAVLVPANQVESRDLTKQEVALAREQVSRLAGRDHRFAALLDEHGVKWEVVGDDGSATWKIADVSEDGTLFWPDA
ncbi:MAG: hypothetical protein ACR2KK_23655 [Acidimicrobiales bacterium]